VSWTWLKPGTSRTRLSVTVTLTFTVTWAFLYASNNVIRTKSGPVIYNSISSHYPKSSRNGSKHSWQELECTVDDCRKHHFNFTFCTIVWKASFIIGLAYRFWNNNPHNYITVVHFCSKPPISFPCCTCICSLSCARNICEYH